MRSLPGWPAPHQFSLPFRGRSCQAQFLPEIHGVVLSWHLEFGRIRGTPYTFLVLALGSHFCQQEGPPRIAHDVPGVRHALYSPVKRGKGWQKKFSALYVGQGDRLHLRGHAMIELREEYLVDERGNRKAVVVPVAEWEKVLELL